MVETVAAMEISTTHCPYYYKSSAISSTIVGTDPQKPKTVDQFPDTMMLLLLQIRTYSVVQKVDRSVTYTYLVAVSSLVGPFYFATNEVKKINVMPTVDNGKGIVVLLWTKSMLMR